MSNLRILHNPRCSKSRQTLQLLEEQGQQPEVIEYLKTPPAKTELVKIFQMLGLDDVRKMMRVKETEFKQQHLDSPAVGNEQLFEAMVNTPKLIERPIVINNGQARIGRPPESVLEII